MEHSIITLEPTVNSNSYDNKIRTPSISPPVRPSESPKYKIQKTPTTTVYKW